MSERAEAERAWRRAEELLYPIVTTRPDLYQVVTGLVRSLADHLGSIPDADALATSHANSSVAADLAAIGAEAGSLDPHLDLDLVRDAAYQLRSRELAQRASTEGTRDEIRRARRDGRAVAVIWRHGENELWPPYRRVEMSLVSGNAISLSTETNPDTMMPSYVVEAYSLDPESGEAVDAEPLAPRREYADADAWRAAAEELRQALFTS